LGYLRLSRFVERLDHVAAVDDLAVNVWGQPHVPITRSGQTERAFIRARLPACFVLGEYGNRPHASDAQKLPQCSQLKGAFQWDFVLWLIAVFLVIAGIVKLFRGEAALGIVLIVVGFLVGPGGVSVFT